MLAGIHPKHLLIQVATFRLGRQFVALFQQELALVRVDQDEVFAHRLDRWYSPAGCLAVSLSCTIGCTKEHHIDAMILVCGGWSGTVGTWR